MGKPALHVRVLATKGARMTRHDGYGYADCYHEVYWDPTLNNFLRWDGYKLSRVGFPRHFPPQKHSLEDISYDEVAEYVAYDKFGARFCRVWQGGDGKISAVSPIAARGESLALVIEPWLVDWEHRND